MPTTRLSYIYLASLNTVLTLLVLYRNVPDKSDMEQIYIALLFWGIHLAVTVIATPYIPIYPVFLILNIGILAKEKAHLVPGIWYSPEKLVAWVDILWSGFAVFGVAFLVSLVVRHYENSHQKVNTS